MRWLQERRNEFYLKTLLKSKGVDFDEYFSPIVRLEAIKLLLGLSYISMFTLY